MFFNTIFIKGYDMKRSIYDLNADQGLYYVTICSKNNISFQEFKSAIELGLSIENMIKLKNEVINENNSNNSNNN